MERRLACQTEIDKYAMVSGWESNGSKDVGLDLGPALAALSGNL